MTIVAAEVGGRPLVLSLLLVLSCSEAPNLESRANLLSASDLVGAMEELVAPSGVEAGIYYRSLGPEPDSVLLNSDIRMHAASTMKVPVMMRLHLDALEGGLSLDSAVTVLNEFVSVHDGTTYSLPRISDSDSSLYLEVGEAVTIRELIDSMITVSSNLATNILMALARAERVTQMMRELGADSIEVLRGVEDIPAFRAGLSNTTTARDLGLAMRALTEGALFPPASRQEMLSVLERQHFRDNIPSGLPEGTRVANKTGWITGINHDAAVVFPEDAPPYVLVVLLRGHPNEDQGTALAAQLSKLVWEYHSSAHS